MHKLLMLGAMAGIGFGIAKYMKKKNNNSESPKNENTENQTQQAAA